MFKQFKKPITFKNDHPLKTYIFLVSIVYFIFIIILKVCLVIITTFSCNAYSIKLIIISVSLKEVMPIFIYVLSVYVLIFYLFYVNSVMFIIECLISDKKWLYQDLIIYSTFFCNTNFTLFDYITLNFVITVTRFLFIQAYNAYLLEPPIGLVNKKTLYAYIRFIPYSKSLEIFGFGFYLDSKNVHPKWWGRQIFVLTVLIKYLALFLLLWWVVFYIFLSIITFKIIFDYEYLYFNTIIPLKSFLLRYLILFFTIPKTFIVNYSVYDVISLLDSKGAPYLQDRIIYFSTRVGWWL